MDSLSETKWDVLISGTGLRNSLLALALSRSNKKILHVDENEYYGGAEAAFSLQEVDEWVARIEKDSSKLFRNASLWKEDDGEGKKLSFSRAYTLALSPQIIFTKSKLLAQLVSSKVYRQLEFQAVGNWWILDGCETPSMRRLPNGREDIFQDKSIDNRAKRGLMKFLKFVVDFENQAEMWEPHAEYGLAGFLSSQFQLPLSLQMVISALTLSLKSPEDTTVGYALPRIARHLTSIGVFGPGFGAVLPKWGGNAEIAQVACRAGAVGGGVYVLGTGADAGEVVGEESGSLLQVRLSNGETVKAKHLIQNPSGSSFHSPTVVSKAIAVVSSDLKYFFENTVEGAPLAAVAVVVIPSNTLESQPNPIYIMVHSSETGECPAGQCVLYATAIYTDSSKSVLDTAFAKLLETSDWKKAKLLYKLYYEQVQSSSSEASLDLAFDDEMLDEVETQWKVAGEEAETATFMRFADREKHDEDDSF